MKNLIEVEVEVVECVHDTYSTFEDEYGLQWLCRLCGSEGWNEYGDE